MRHQSRRRLATSALWLSISVILRVCQGHEIDLDGCGETKACFLDPEGCSAASCELALTWRNDGDDAVLFELSASVDNLNSWVAFGLSNDAKMVTFRQSHYSAPDRERGVL